MPPLNFLINQAIGYIARKSADALELEAFFIYTNYSVDQQGKDYVNAARKAIGLEGKATLEELEKARKEADNAFKKLVKFV